MAFEIGTVTNGGGRFANQNLLLKIQELAEASGWVTLRYNAAIEPRELILKGEGLSGDEEIFIGFRSYQSEPADYYNITVAGFVGYVAANAFTAQPGYRESGIPTHNLNIGYWIAVNAQRIALALKVGTPVYECAYVGKMLPYQRPGQYNYPLVVAGMLSGAPATRYSDTSQSMPWKGNRVNLGLRRMDGSWIQPYCWPWSASALTSSTQLRDTGGAYTLQPVVLHNNSNENWGELDGVFHIAGFNNAVENTLVIDDVTYVVMQDVYRVGFPDYFALRMS